MSPVTNKQGQVAMKPEAIAQYNKYMLVVERQDQMLAYCPCEKMTLGINFFLIITTKYKNEEIQQAPDRF